MSLTRHLARLLWSGLRYGVAERRLTIIALIIGGLLVVALSVGAQAAAPLILYPFA